MNAQKSVVSEQSRAKVRRLACIMLMSFVLLGPKAMAQSGVILVNGGNITMNITTGAAGSEPVAVVNTVTTLTYWRPSVLAKVTVRTSCPGQKFALDVVATGVTKGVAASAVALTDGMLAVDFITGIPKTPASWTSTTATLRYIASATFAQGNSAEMGDDVHAVTYTLQAQ